LVFTPWPISVAPVETWMLPSARTWTRALAWLRCGAVKLIPYLTGVSAMPRSGCSPRAFQASIGHVPDGFPSAAMLERLRGR